MSDIPQSCKIQTPNAIADGQENYDMTSVNIYIAPSEYIHHGGDKIVLLCISGWKVAEKIVEGRRWEERKRKAELSKDILGARGSLTNLSNVHGQSNAKGLVLKGLDCQ